jgi:hypothetical protein
LTKDESDVHAKAPKTKHNYNQAVAVTQLLIDTRALVLFYLLYFSNSLFFLFFLIFFVELLGAHMRLAKGISPKSGSIMEGGALHPTYYRATGYGLIIRGTVEDIFCDAPEGGTELVSAAKDPLDLRSAA